MKRIISLFLCLLITLSTVTVAFASSASSNDTAIEASGQLQRVSEIVELREPNSDTYLLSDGTYECVVYAEDKYYYDEARTLRLIDNTVKANDTLINTYGEYKNAANSFDIFFSNGVTPEVTILNQTSKLIFSPITSANNKSGLISETTSSIDIGKIDNCKPLDILTQTGDNTVRYENIFPETDLVYVVGNHALKEYIVLNNSNAPNEFGFEFSIEGLKVDNEAGTPRFVDATGNTMFALGQLFAIDANEVVSNDLQYEMVPSKSSDKLTIRVIVSKEYLDDPLREFPVVIDPTVLISSAQTADTYVCNNFTDKNYYMEDYLRTGRDDPYGIRRSYIKFSIPDSVPRYGITNAYLDLEKKSGVDPTVRAYRCTSAWKSNSITWNNKPGYDTVYQSTTSALRSGSTTWYRMNVTNIVKRWLNGTYSNNGFVIKDINESDSTHWTTFYSSDAISPHKPELRIVYTNYYLTVNHYLDQGYNVRFDNASSAVASHQTVVSSILSRLFGLSVSHNIYYSFESNADICKISTYGAVTASNLTKTCQHSTRHLSTSALRNHLINSKGSGTTTLSRVLWTGHILANNPSSNSVSANHTVIMTPKHTTDSNYVNKSAATVNRESRYTLLHETSHQLGAPDHYCYGIDTSTGKCGNPNCCSCNGEPVPAKCMMNVRCDVEGTALLSLYCSDCINDIMNHIKNHH